MRWSEISFLDLPATIVVLLVRENFPSAGLISFLRNAYDLGSVCRVGSFEVEVHVVLSVLESPKGTSFV